MRSTYELQTSDFVELPCHFPSGFPGLHQVPKVLKRTQAGIEYPPIRSSSVDRISIQMLLDDGIVIEL